LKVLAALLLALALAGCASGRFWVRASGDPSCESLCDYYVACRDISDSAIHGACVAECREIFYEDGQPDTRSLRDFQRLECSEAVAFIEGSSGRPPGAKADNQGSRP